MTSTCFEPEGSFSGRRLQIQVWYSVFYMQYKTDYTDACKTHCTIPVFTAVFLKMNSQFRNM